MQEDILYESLTVRETLTYVAMLRLGKTVTVRTLSPGRADLAGRVRRA